MTEPLNILFEDNHILVVNKPAGILTQPGGTDQTNVEDLAKAWLKKKYNKPGNVFLEALHRIDKPVSGIVLFAKTSKALSRLQQAMRTKQSNKKYCAVVEGSLNPSEGLLEDYLFHDDHFARVVDKETPQAKWARLSYKTIDAKSNHSLMEIILDTGRYHQIRIQFASRKHPIVGDVRYNSKSPFRQDAIMLHHCKLQIPHPITNALTTFLCPPPATWNSFLDHSGLLGIESIIV